MSKPRISLLLPAIVLALVVVISGATLYSVGVFDDLFDGSQTSTLIKENTDNNGSGEAPKTIKTIKDAVYTGEPYVEINGNVPFFKDSELVTVGYEHYSDLDELGRCGVAMACVGTEIMPTEKRGNISSIHPTGWVQHKYPFVDGEALYNRSHLIGYQLSGENANKKNLITGTRYFNAQTMVPFEEQVANYVKSTNNHVMYRVTPYFEGDNLLCNGVEMEAYSVEDNGDGVCYNIFAFNVQPGVVIDYTTGDNHLE